MIWAAGRLDIWRKRFCNIWIVVFQEGASIQMADHPRLPAAASDEHVFYELGAKPFEHFARALHEAQDHILGSQLYGPDGQPQFGADHIAFYQGPGGPAIEVGQSKAMRRFTAANLEAAGKAFLDHWSGHWQTKNVRAFILFVGCAIKNREAADKIIELTARFSALGVAFHVWDANGIYDRLRGAPSVVRTHLGQAWYAHLFGEPAGPLTGLHRELQTGDLAALRVQGYVARLNQAEAAEIAEWRRRIRRGESDKVAAELRYALADPAGSGATAPELRAQQLRLLAGILLPGGEASSIKAMLDEADRLDGTSERLRAVLLMESVGPEAALESLDSVDQADLAEVRSIAQLRLGRADLAGLELALYLNRADTSAETLRISALAALLEGDRTRAVDLADEATRRDANSRACAHVLAIALYHRALSPAAEISVGEWPTPVEQPLVHLGDSARADLERAEAILAGLASDDSLADHQSLVTWHAAVMACMPWRHKETQELFDRLQGAVKLPPALIVWAMSRAIELDWAAAEKQCDERIAADAGDHETVVIAIALATFRKQRQKAATLLAAHREALEASGHGRLLRYWTGVIAIEGHQDVSDAFLAENPWFRLRIATRKHNGKKRLKAIGELLEQQLEGIADPRVVLAATQNLLEGGWHKTAAKAAAYLVAKIGSAEAISVAIHAYYRAGRYSEALAALGNTDAFPGGVLPVRLETIRIHSLAATGNLLEARDASLAVARASGKPDDLWRAIEYNLSVGAVPHALALYDEHSATLSEKPAPGHVLLARATLRSDPDAAARITRQLAGVVPDELVTATFELAAKLRLADEQNMLLVRIQSLGQMQTAGVQKVDLEDVKKMMRTRREQVEKAYETYANGHAPVHAFAGFRPEALALTYLGPLLSKSSAETQMPMLSARYGRRFDETVWPEKASDLTLLIDVTALLTAHGLDLLDKIERSFGTIAIAADCVALLIEFRNGLEIMQPDRVEAKRRVLSRVDAGSIASRAPSDDLNPFGVLWEAETGESNSTLSVTRLFETLAEEMTADDVDVLHDALGSLLDDPAVGVAPPPGSAVTLEPGMIEALELGGATEALLARYRLILEPDEIAVMRRDILESEARKEVSQSLDKLIARLNQGIEDGSYRTTPVKRSKETSLLRRSYMQVIEALAGSKATIAWIDDRFSSSIHNPDFRVVTTVEMIAALEHYGRLSPPATYQLRQALRRARWMFMPVIEPEIVHFLRAATRDGDVTETPDLILLRRSIGELLLHRRRLQWPHPQAAENGARGEVPLLLDTGHAVTGALAAIWRDHDWTEADAVAASNWIVDNIEINLFPLPVLAADDPRSDHLIGVHWASLLLTGMQIDTGKRASARRKAFFNWVWDDLLAHAARTRPEIWPSLEDMLAEYLVKDPADEGPQEEKIWIELAGQTVDAMPSNVRRALLARSDILEAFSLVGSSQVNLGVHSFDEEGFWRTTASVTREPSSLTTTKGIEAVFRVAEEGGGISVAIGEDQLTLDPWPTNLASDDIATRRLALETRREELDLDPQALEALAQDLGTIADKGARVEHVLTETRKTIAQSYSDHRAALQARRAFVVADLLPDEATMLTRLLRLDDSIDAAAETLIRERGLIVAIERFSCLPIAPPTSMARAVAALSDDETDDLLRAAADASPWTQLFTCRLIGIEAGNDRHQAQVKALIEDALGEESDALWSLYAALARYFAAYGPTIAGWKDLGLIQRLATPWLHAGMMTAVLADGGVIVGKLVKLLDQSRFASPRFVVEPQKDDQDLASPRHALATRSKTYAAAPLLLQFHKGESEATWATEHLTALLLGDTDVPATARLEIAQGALLEQDRMGSYFAEELSGDFENVQPSFGGLFRPGIVAMVKGLLEARPGTMEAASAWFFLRQASADGPLPPDVSEYARAAAAAADFSGTPRGMKEARQLLLSFSAIAAACGWTDEAERIETALSALSVTTDEDGENDTDILLLEIAFRRALLEPDAAARTRILGTWLTKLGRQERLRDLALVAAKHFARGLAGQHSEPFVDVIAELYLAD